MTLFSFTKNYIVPKDKRGYGLLNDLDNQPYLVSVVHLMYQDYIQAALDDKTINRVDAISLLAELKTYSY